MTQPNPYVVGAIFYPNSGATRDVVTIKLTTLRRIIVAGLTSPPGRKMQQPVQLSNAVETLPTIFINSFVVPTKFTRRGRTEQHEAAAAARSLTRLKIYAAGLMCIQMVCPTRYVVVGKHTIRTLRSIDAVVQSFTLLRRNYVVTKARFT